MIEIIKYILAAIGLVIIVYVLSKIQMAAWLNVIEKFLNHKTKENEQTKKE